jgi:hypothetical protein
VLMFSVATVHMDVNLAGSRYSRILLAIVDLLLAHSI